MAKNDNYITATGGIESTNSLSPITIPAGVQDCGIEFVDGNDGGGSSPRIISVNHESPVWNDLQQLKGKNKIDIGGCDGYHTFVHILKIPNVEITNFASSRHLVELINANWAFERQLFVSSEPQYVDWILGSMVSELTPSGAIYKHDIPTLSAQELGISFMRFPPIVHSVATTSPLYRRAVPGQTVQALLVPGSDRFDLQSGGFRSDVLRQRLDESMEIPGRKLVLKDAIHTAREKGSSEPFDDCCIIT